MLTDQWSSYRQVHREEGASRRTRGSRQREQNERERSDPLGAGKTCGRVHVGWAWMTMGRILVPGEEPRAPPTEEGNNKARPRCERRPVWQFLLGMQHVQGTAEQGAGPRALDESSVFSGRPWIAG